MKLNITDKHFLEIVKQGHSLDGIFLLKLLHEGNEIDSLCREHEKISLIKQSLIRKHLISEDGHLYPEGQDLVIFFEQYLYWWYIDHLTSCHVFTVVILFGMNIPVLL